MGELFTYLFSAGFLKSIVRMSTPIIFSAMAALLASKADIFCVAFEGMMLFAALGGVLGSALTGSLLVGMLVGIVSSLIIAAIFSYFVLVVKTKPMLVGLALNILGTGGTVYILYMFTGQKATSISLASLQFPQLEIPLIKDIPFVGEIISGQNILTYLAFISVVIVYIMLYKTPLGLKIRTVGENPNAAESLGVDVVKTKVIAMMIGGLFAAFGGMFMSMGYTSFFTKNMVNGRGFTGIAAQNLGLGKPLLTLLCALLFGLADAFGIAMQSYRIPSQIASMSPYVTTLVGLIVIGKLNERRIRKHALQLGAREAEEENGRAGAEGKA